MKFIAFAFILLTIVGCDQLKDTLSDCINLDGPRFDEDDIPVAVLNEEYFAEITVSIENNSYDAWYAYDFEYVGNLPYGLEFVVNDDNRSIQIIGTPLQVGSYNIKIKVRATEQEGLNNNQYYENTQIEDPFTEEPYDDGDDLCRSRQSKEFTLEVKAFTS